MKHKYRQKKDKDGKKVDKMKDRDRQKDKK